MRKVMFLLIAMTLLFTLSGQSEAKNPDISYWMKNISESALPGEPGDVDQNPQIVVVGSTVHVMWITTKAAGSVYDLYYRRSTDGGETWEVKQLLFEDTGFFKNYLGDSTVRKMAVDGNTVHIFQNRGILPTQGSWYSVLTYFRSTDNGATFEAPRNVVTSGELRIIEHVYASAADGKVTVGYTDFLNWKTDHYVMVLTSDDGGTSFGSHVAYSRTRDGDYIRLNFADMQRVGDKIYALVSCKGACDLNSGAYLNERHLISSTNAGAGFTDKIISTSSLVDYNPMQDYHYVPKIAAAGSNVYVTFNGPDSEGVNSVYYSRSTDSGETFGEAVNLSKAELPGKNIQLGQETVVAKGEYVYIVFLTTDAKVHLKRSTDSGATILPIQELTAPAGCKYIDGGWWPVAVADPADATGQTVHIFWTAPTYMYSTNGGATFTNPVMTATNFTLSAYNRPQMAVGTDSVIHFTGEGNIRAGYDQDIFYRSFAPVAPAPLASNKAMNFHSEYLNGDVFLGIYDNMQVKASSDTNFKTAMTAEAWIKPNRDPDKEGYFIFKADPGAGGAWGSYMLGQWRDGKVDARITTTSGGFVLVAGDPVPNNVWTHVAMTYDAAGGANNFKIYVNGILAGSQTVTGNLATDSGILFIGGDKSNRYWSDVTVDELRLWNKALSQAEIVDYMSGPIVGTEPGLAAYYNFNDTTKDITGHGNDGVLMYQEDYVAGAISFGDVPLDYWAYEYICSIYNAGITTGCAQTPLNYCPSNNVTRQAMAAFIIRALYVEDFTYTLAPYFTDVPDTHQFFKYIQKMRELNITTGCTATEYCPGNNVTRQAMAAFLIRAKLGETFTYTSTPYFTDVPATNQFFKYVQKMKDEGITTGCTATEYCPANNVTRASMAAFLARAFLGMP